MRVAASVIWCACMLCSALGNCEKESQGYCSLGQGQMKADIASVLSLLTQQPSTKACKTSCHNAKGNRRTAYAEYSEYSNKSCSTTQTANLFFVVSILMSKSLPVAGRFR